MSTFYPKRLRTSLFSFLFLVVTSSAWAQLEVTDATTPPFDPINLIENIFLGGGVDVINVTYTGDPIAVGFFNGENSNIGIERGILMTSGAALNAIGPNTGAGTSTANSGGFDADIANIANNNNVNDAAVYEITFRPFADTLRFDYVFASEEYDEFVCAGFNDAFGFFIQGPNYPTPTNIALIPGTTIGVAIDNVNNGGGGCPPTNVQYYVNNAGGPTIEYDAFTTVLTAEAVVVPCQTYTIKLAIADLGDSIYDSGVFLKGNSFGTDALDITLNTPGPDSIIVEGCVGGSIVFSLVDEAVTDMQLDYTFFGDAIYGVDYAPVPLDTFIAAGTDKVTLYFDPYEDNLPEGQDTIFIDIQVNPCERDTFVMVIEENELVPPIADDITICEGDTGTLSAIYPLPLPTSTTFSYQGPPVTIPDNDPSQPVFSTINVFNVTPSIIEEGSILSVCVDLSHPWDGDVDIYLLAPTGQFLELSTDNGGSGDNYTNTCFTEIAINEIQGLTSSSAPFSGDWLPEGPWSDLYGGNPNGDWTLIVSDDANGFTGTLNGWSITFPPIYTVGYTWSPADGLDCTNCDQTGAHPDTTTMYYVTATDTYGCFTVDSALVTVIDNLPAPNITCDNSVFGEITFSWDPIPGAAGYEVNVDAAGWELSNGGLSHVLTGLGLGQTVTIEVRATGVSCNISSASLTCSAQTCTFNSTLDNVTDVTCPGGMDGSVIVTSVDGTGPFQFSLNGMVQNNGSYSGLAAGMYDMFISDANGCGSAQSFTIAEPDVIQLSLSSTDVTCNGSGNGTATVSVTGGTGPYNYSWDDPLSQNSPFALNLSGNIYTVTVTDAVGCEETASITVDEPDMLSFTFSPTDVDCNGAGNGELTSTVMGGIPPYQYTWSTGDTDDSISGLSGGNYSVTITDGNLCETGGTILIAEPSALALSTSSNEASCNGGADGSATVTAVDGTPGYTYQWDSAAGNQTTASATGLTFGNYTVTVTDLNACQETASINVTEFASVAFITSGSLLNCFGDSDGTVSVFVSAGTPPYTYAWSTNPIQTTPSVSGLVAGSYTVTITDGTGCNAIDVAQVTEPSELALSVSGTDVLCFGDATGTANSLVSGGTSPYTYSWSNGSTADQLNSLTAGVYDLTVTDANNCIIQEQISITEPAELVTSGTVVNDVLCNGESTGVAFFATLGGTAPYTFLWDNGETDETAIALDVGMASFTVTDQNGCIAIESVMIGEPPALSISTTLVQDAVCNASATGSATVAGSGGSPPYTYEWDNGETDATAVSLSAGPRDVTITDFNGCSVTANQMIAEPPPLTASVNLDSDVQCHGEINGRATVSPGGGVPPYIFLWDSGETTATAFALAEGPHTMSVTDANGCLATADVVVSQPDELLSSISSTPALCNGEASGAISVMPIGGTSGYTYLWDNGATDGSLIDVGSGIYNVTVTDANGCVEFNSGTVLQPPALSASLTSLPVSCFAGSDGSTEITASGGTAPYDIQWGPSAGGQTTVMATGLVAGTYDVEVTDSNGCSITEFIDVTEPAEAVSLTVDFTEPNCFSGLDGTATVTATGGTGAYTFQWGASAGNQQSQTAVDIPAGTHLVSVTDANGCLETSSVVVSEPTELQVSISSVPESCIGSDGSAIVVPSGGSGNYTYLWSSGHTSENAIGLVEGDYTVNVTDENACSATAAISVEGPTPIEITISSLEVSCFAGTDGEATAIATGGQGGFVYEWSDPASQQNSTAQNLTAGTYIVTATDSGGCTETAEILISEPDVLTSSITVVPVSCNGNFDGEASVTVSGGVDPYSYAWSNSNSSDAPLGTGLPADTYLITITDSNGCTVTNTFEITEPEELTITSLTMEEVNCSGGSDGSAQVQVEGGTQPYTYSWNDSASQISPTAVNLDSGFYTVSIVDANGCQVSDNIEVTQPEEIVLALSQQSSNCFQGNDGQAIVQVSGGTVAGDYTYLWSNGHQTSIASSLIGGQTYAVTVSDDRGCTEISEITIDQPAAIELFPEALNVSCFAGDDGQTSVTPLGGTAPYNYSWSGSAFGQTGSTATGLTAGLYFVTVSDVFNCTSVTSVLVDQPLRLTLDIETEDVECRGESTGSALAIPGGGTPPYTYTWNDVSNQNGREATGLAMGNYTVTVSDANGCQIEQSTFINEPSIDLAVDFVPFDVTCYGENDGSVDVIGTGGTPPYEFSIDGEYYNASNLIPGLTAGNYTLFIRDLYGCISQTEFVINEPDEFLVEAGPEVTIEYGDSTVLHAVPTLTDNIEYQWTAINPDPSLNCLDCQDVWVKPEYDTEYEVVVTNQEGCVARDRVIVRVIQVDRVFIANAFSPNGDGANDIFFVQGGKGTFSVRTLRVYDRWGELVFERFDSPLNSPEFGWDGSFNNKELNPGVFVYYSEVEFTDGSIEQYKGSVTLLK